MGRVSPDITGLEKGYLKVIRLSSNSDKHGKMWTVECVCGVIRDMYYSQIVRIDSPSCGCKVSELTTMYKTTHKMTDSITYKSWEAMKSRCYNENAREYKNYGGAGITVCDDWRCSFEQFLLDMKERPSLKYSLDRFPNSTGNYEPCNCRWATRREQNTNKKNNVIIEMNGISKTGTEWAEEFGILPSTVLSRYKRGLSLEEVFNTSNLRGSYAKKTS